MAASDLKPLDNNKGGSLDHVNLVRSCLSTSILLNHALGEFSRKKKDLRNIVHANFLALCGPKPRTTSLKTKTKNHQSSS